MYYVCMHACVCTYIRMYKCMNASSMYIRLYARTYICMYACR